MFGWHGSTPRRAFGRVVAAELAALTLLLGLAWPGPAAASTNAGPLLQLGLLRLDRASAAPGDLLTASWSGVARSELAGEHQVWLVNRSSGETYEVDYLGAIESAGSARFALPVGIPTGSDYAARLYTGHGPGVPGCFHREDHEHLRLRGLRRSHHHGRASAPRLRRRAHRPERTDLPARAVV